MMTNTARATDLTIDNINFRLLRVSFDIQTVYYFYYASIAIAIEVPKLYIPY